MEKDELIELKGFVADLKADRQATKDKEKREAWTKYTSLSIVMIAVLTAVATGYGGKYSSRVLVGLNHATFNQAKASDQWNFYQAKGIKQALVEDQLLQLQRGAFRPEDAAKLEAKIKQYDQDKADIKASAEDYEKKQGEDIASASYNSDKGSWMGTSVYLFQISIAIGSVCLIMKRKWLWFLSLAIAMGATGWMFITFCR
jgi:hypothetical protein